MIHLLLLWPVSFRWTPFRLMPCRCKVQNQYRAKRSRVNLWMWDRKSFLTSGWKRQSFPLFVETDPCPMNHLKESCWMCWEYSLSQSCHHHRHPCMILGLRGHRCSSFRYSHLLLQMIRLRYQWLFLFMMPCLMVNYNQMDQMDCSWPRTGDEFFRVFLFVGV